MWLFTRAGFFSVVDKKSQGRGVGEVCVRARIAADFDSLRKLYFPDMPDITFESNTDYPYRIYVGKKQWAKVSALMSEDVTYDNFKSMVGKEQGYDRSHLYGEVWGVMFKAEQKLERPIASRLKRG
jgi:hypothetical protein